MITLNFGTVRGLTVEELRQLCDLADVYQYHQGRNAIKDKYYEGHVTLNDVNLGIALPRGLRNLEVGCNWGQKAVDALASRSMFDGFVGSGTAADTVAQLVNGIRQGLPGRVEIWLRIRHPVIRPYAEMPHPISFTCYFCSTVER